MGGVLRYGTGVHGRLSSGPIPKFVSSCGTLVYELRNPRTTSNSMILVPLLNPKLAIAFAARCARTSGSKVALSSVPLVPTFVQARAAKEYKRRNRDTSRL